MNKLLEWYDQILLILKEEKVFGCLTNPNEIELEDDFQKSLNKQIDDIFCDTLMLKNENEEVNDMFRDKTAREVFKHVREEIEKTRIQKKSDKFIDSVIDTRILLNEKHDSRKSYSNPLMIKPTLSKLKVSMV
ncbi:hypothetical protein Kpol_1018p145 [Vanderwaltozyma polyspora DSM 70294]|uniref:Uncharacterized protein n=1 Tax=Vanderwaltozyma polyspora (strain ATCC 22028 / DSM 70294 / BCRC 21397 / CBS 2163 / NBRC 10782 / NRRL Y-8283 / UCD 57-17) TaxID=436907 RepID=A7TDY7_VANPO|nr:uncharacterized protein Kpol_1018p145 [Vanderwaltozyma polyspora DSM 70294]EDO19607.1 hypothetical protein Kpol_1018p145 [Vanderwaltozyma polyspora DSM 70294]